MIRDFAAEIRSLDGVAEILDRVELWRAADTLCRAEHERFGPVLGARLAAVQSETCALGLDASMAARAWLEENPTVYERWVEKWVDAAAALQAATHAVVALGWAQEIGPLSRCRAQLAEVSPHGLPGRSTQERADVLAELFSRVDVKLAETLGSPSFERGGELNQDWIRQVLEAAGLTPPGEKPAGS